MNYKKLITGLFLAGSFVFIAAFSSDNNGPLQHIVTQLGKWSENYPIEKVYLQLDKPYYAVGDDIWFKAYVTVGAKHQLSGLSGNLVVELIDERDSVKQRIKLPLISGLAWGDFALSDTLQEGNYRIRAYTNWMRNFGNEYFFDKEVTIVNSSTNKVFTTSNYTYSTVNGQQQVTTNINYADIDGVPYANKPVKYAVDLGLKSSLKGKGVTDDKGNLVIVFPGGQPGALGPGMITTNIDIGNKNIVTKNVLIRATSANVDMQFFPESGSLVNSINSKVAFKAVGADGLGVDVKGTVTDDQNNTVTTFGSQHLGMGVFKFEPQAGRTYKANVTFADVSSKTYNLPNAIDRGYVLSIDNSDPNTVGIKVSTSRAILQDNAPDTLIVIAQSGGQVYYAGKSKPGSATFTASINKSRFPSGIAQFMLFSSKGEPLNERLVFIQNPDQLKLDVDAGKQTFAPREKVKINLGAKSADDKPVVGSFSVSVIDETKVPVNEDDESTILTNLLLTSDLKGYVEKPNYYFDTVNNKTQADLDLLMLTQGYRRFEWKKILNDDFPPVTFQPEKTLQVSGHITTLGGKPVPHARVSLVSNTGGLFYEDTVTDEQGHFTFANLLFKDSVRFIVQARTSKDRKNVAIDLDNTTPQLVTTGKNAPDMKVNINTGLSAYLQSSKQFHDMQMRYGLGNHSIVLKEIVIKDTHAPVLKYSDNLNGPGNADQVLTADKLPPGCVDLSQCLQGYLNFVLFRNGIPYSTRGGMMKFMVDGIPIQNDEISNINPADVESIEVLRTPIYYAIYGSQSGPGGLIIITTKRGGDMDDELMSRPAPGIIVFDPKGYYKARVFYSPNYDDPKTNREVADARTTIYWNPDIITDKNGTASFEFYNAGSKGNYRVVVEGIDNDGNIGRKVYHYSVE
jgi:hypothetical protein